MDELDEFNEAPHSLRSEASSFHELSHDDMERIDLDDDDDDDDQNQIINILDRTVPGQIRATDLLSDDTTTIIQKDSLMFDESMRSIYHSNSNGHLKSKPQTSIVCKSDKLTNSGNGEISDVLILTNKSKDHNYDPNA